MAPDNEPIVISEKTVEVANQLYAIGWNNPNDAQWLKLQSWIQNRSAINSSTAPLKAEIERLQKELADYKESEEGYSATFAYIDKHLGKPGEHSVPETIDNTVARLHSLSQQNEQLEKHVLELRNAIAAIYDPNTGCEDFSEYNKVKTLVSYSFHPGSVIDENLKKALSYTPADIAKKWVRVEAYKKLKTELEMCDPAYVWDLARQRYTFSGSDPNASVYSNHLADICRRHKETLTLAQKELEK